MAINDPKRKLQTLTIPEVDVALLKKQTKAIKTVLRTPHSGINHNTRESLCCIHTMLTSVLNGDAVDSPPERKVFTKVDGPMVNRIKDLSAAGGSIKYIAEKVGCSAATISRVRAGEYNTTFKYIPSEFALEKENANQAS